MKRTTALTLILILSGVAAFTQDVPDLFYKAVHLQEVKGDLEAAIPLFEKVVSESKDPSLAAKAQLRIGMCYEKLGQREAQAAYQKVIDSYPQQHQEVALARERIAALAQITAVGAVSAPKPVFHKLKIQTRITFGGQLSPDGRSFVYSNPPDATLWRMPIQSEVGPYVPGAPAKVYTGNVNVDPHGFAWSADGRWIAFNDGEKPGIFMVPVEGGEPRKVRDEVRRGARIVNWDLSLSPDAKTLAFTALDGDEPHIYSVPVGGGIPKRLTDFPSRVGAYSPDGAWLAFTGACGPPQPPGDPQRNSCVCIMPATGGGASLVADVDSWTPVWSPDGGMIAFIVRGEKPNGQIWIVPMSGEGRPAGEPAKIAAPQGVTELNRLLGWAPGNKIGIISRSLEFALYTVPAAGGKAAAIKIGGYATQPRWSPDGERIYYRDGDGQIAFIPAEGGDASIVSIQSETKFVIGDPGAGLAISPDGHRIVFSGTKKGIAGRNIWTLPIDGGTPMQLTVASAPFEDQFPCWSPDGKSIAFVRTQKDDRYWLGFRAEIYIVAAAGGEVERITDETDQVNLQAIAWSPDGTMLAYISRDVTYMARDWKPAGSWDVWDGSLKVYSLRERKSRSVTRVQGTIVNAELAWSPDSRRIAYNDSYRNNGPIKVVSLDDGIAKEVETNLVNTNICNLSWSPDGRKLAFMGWYGGGPELWLMEDFISLIKSK